MELILLAGELGFVGVQTFSETERLISLSLKRSRTALLLLTVASISTASLPGMMSKDDSAATALGYRRGSRLS